MTVAIKIRCTHHCPALRESWTIATTNVNVVVHVPDRCLMRPTVVKHVIRSAITVKIGGAHEFPSTGKGRPVSAPDE